MFWLIFTIAVWGIVHSWLASLGIKDSFRRMLGNRFMKFYRLFYNIFAVISIMPVLYLMISAPDQMLYQVSSPWSYLMRAGQAGAVLLLLLAVLQTDVLSFVGLRQLIEAEEKSQLVTSGLYRFVRHPLYTLALILCFSVNEPNTCIVYSFDDLYPHRFFSRTQTPASLGKICNASP
jgi:protein-S-isoprenylcysteine O-methyltransferase Ste14